ncbi:MAG: flagellar basal body rod protein FlgB [Candidatus Sumerlaeia bacterium]
MAIDAIFGGTIQVLEQGAQVRMARNGMLAANIANAETPNYRAVDIDFKETMARYLERDEKPAPPVLELQKSDERHISIMDLRQPLNRQMLAFAAGDDTSIGNDNNSVNLEVQLARREANTLYFNMTVQMLNKKYAGLGRVIEGGSGQT